MSLTDALAEIEQTLDGGTLAVAARFLPTGETVFYNADRISPTASVIKVAIVAEWYCQVAEGRLDADALDTLPPGEIVGGSGVLGLLNAVTTPGLTLPMRDLVTLAIAVSDNTASNRVLAAVGGPSAVNDRMHGSWGMNRTTLHRPIRFQLKPDDLPHTATGTPNDMLRFLSGIAHSDTPVSRAVWKLLETCQDNSLLPRYLTINPYADDLQVARPPFMIAHKTGAITGVRNDAALITRGDQTLAVAVFTHGCPDPTWTPANRGSKAVGHVGKLLCAHFFA